MLGEISFAGRKAQNIKCHDTKSRILKEIEEDYKTRIIQRHHERFVEAHTKKLSSNPYMIGVRTNGNPYLLYLTRLNFINQCIFIDKKIQQGYSAPRMIIARFSFDDSLFSGTLLDGEMIVDNDGNWLFLVGDLVAHCGTYLENVNLIRRMNIVYPMFEGKFQPDPFDVCHFQVKRYFQYEEMHSLISEFVPDLNYTCRGLYFKPMYLKFSDILYNFDDTLIKKVYRQRFASETKGFLEMEDVVPAPQNQQAERAERAERAELAERAERAERAEWADPTSRTTSLVEMEMEKQLMARRTGMPDVYILEELNTMKEIGLACIPTMDVSRYMRNLFKNKNINERLEISCTKCTKQSDNGAFDGKWVPLTR